MDANHERSITAHHEAGHFVAELVLKPSSVLGTVSIVSDDETLGRCTAEAVELWDEFLPDAKLIEAEVVCLLAGHAADRRFEPSEEREQISIERASSDFEKARRFCDYLGIEMDVFHKKANQFVDDHWGEITCLARALLIENTLCADEASIWIDVVTKNEQLTSFHLEVFPKLKRLLESF
jgi:ATP-dependent Zn protease